jgi:hypothetical protein
MQTKNKFSLIILIAVLIISLSGISFASLGTYKQNSCVQIKTILNASWVNISTISFPNSNLASSNKIMSKIGQTFNYSFCNTSIVGTYVYDYIDSNGDVYVNDFDITSTGNNNGNTIPLFLLLGGFLILGIALWQRNPIIGFFSGSIFIIAGIYLMIFGLGALWNDYTRMISYVTLGLGLVISFISMIELFYQGDEEE